MRKILEIGGGRAPYFVRYEIDFSPEDSFTSIDISDENIKYAKERLASWQNQGKPTPQNYEFINMDGNNTTFADGFFDEVVISNTLSAPIHENWDRDGNFITSGGHDGKIKRQIEKKEISDDPFLVERQALLSEAKRVLKKDGVISIYTDLIIYGIDSYQKILQQMVNDPKFFYQRDTKEEGRIDELNKHKLTTKEYCSCFRAEVLPKSEVHRFYGRDWSFS